MEGRSALLRSVCSLRSLWIRSSSVIDGCRWIRLSLELYLCCVDRERSVSTHALSPVVSDGVFVFLSFEGDAMTKREGGE